ncbi:GPI ethanolamine phosphate transferase 3 [Mycena indigotica]|uniref:GPI ethanolamine phosphate transferase 3 n=1 Tax=Mycena indigotica TaxID=2126181 RepID=A0A8H6SKL0_9AGAR|nr:GPI ethanolamine phosphate transferase 3 [Mycena indigotica]KAF7301116.1 GPI ethanolamine phosphate transferase 3 [Mycena indigotica]
MAFSKGFALLSLVFLVHLAGIYLFTSGFLLTRLSLPNFTQCPDKSCILPPTHKRAVLLIIDSLRFDFISPNPPVPSSPFHHNILTLPHELTAAHPQNSFLFNAYSDAPTATLQRIKALTTGSLPTFVDIGNNFGGSAIAEDSIMKQLRLAGKKIAFMGDDTWMSVYPDSFALNMTFPEDSFNVEDLHTVDEGVIRHIFPLLEDNSKPFDFLIGHFLGVDHVGHRVGPDHSSMKDKLKQMDTVLRRVVDLLDHDTLLVVLGDHGMDRSGDHGGDGDLETSSAMWVYSKGAPLSTSSSKIPSGLLQYKTFPNAPNSHRWIQQIDIVPSLSLLLGLPIPFNNLGSIIPELFWRDQTLENALAINVQQIKDYLDAYRASASGSELDDAWPNLLNAWTATQSTTLTNEQHLITLVNYTRVAVAACRAIWAQFNPVLMGLGLVLLGVGIVATWAAYSGFSKVGDRWDEWLESQLMNYVRGAAIGSIMGLGLYYVLETSLTGMDALDVCVFGAMLMACVVLIASSPPSFSSFSLPVILLILHSVAFTSNSFTFWEDRMVPFLLVSSLAPFIRKGVSAPTPRLRYRILGFSLLFAVCVRLMSISTVCREEQQPYCHVTFYASSSLPAPPTLVLYMALPTAFAIPWTLRRFLRVSRSHLGLAKIFLPAILLPALTAGAGYWFVEWADSAGVVDAELAALLRIARTWVARSIVLLVFGGGLLWWTVPLCLDIIEATPNSTNEKRQVTVIGYANAFGSSYLLFWSGFLAVIYLTTQLTGQLVLGLMVVALMAHLEVIDSTRDVRLFDTLAASNPSALLEPNRRPTRSPPITFADIVPVALLGLHAFYGTGHQAVISSIQWKTAFLLTPTMHFSLSATTVILNSVGAILLAALAVPLLSLWNRSPLPSDQKKNKTRPDTQIHGESVIAGLGIMLYYASLLFGAAVSAAILRRHLMVWKVFAPRFMLAVVQLIVVDVGVLVGFGLGVQHVGGHVAKMFRGVDTQLA